MARKSHRTAVIVLGMHHSGTPALAGILARLGCDIPGTSMPANPTNAKGFYEPGTIRLLNDAILESAGSSWMDWEPLNAGWSKSAAAAMFHDRALTALSEEFGDSRLFLLEDPRICRLMPFWNDVLKDAGCTPLIIHTHSAPLEVAASLEKVHGFDPAFSQLLWLRHVLDAEWASRKLKRHFTSYQKVLTNWAQMAKQTQEDLDLSWPRISRKAKTEISAFLSADLRNFQFTTDAGKDSPLASDWVRESFAILEKWTVSGETAGDRDRLDEIRNQLNTSGPIFSDLVENGRLAGMTLKTRNEQLAEKDVNVRSLEGQLTQVTEQLAEKADNILSLEDALTKAEDQSAQAQDRLSFLESSLDQRTTEAEDWARQAKRAEEALATAQSSVASLENDLEVLTSNTKNSLAEKDNAVRRLNAEIAQMIKLTLGIKDALTKAEKQSAQAQDRLSFLESSLNQRTTEAEDWARQAKRAKETLATAQSTVANLKNDLKALTSNTKNSLAKKDNMVRRMTAEIAQMKNLMKRMKIDNEKKYTSLTKKYHGLVGKYREVLEKSNARKVRLQKDAQQKTEMHLQISEQKEVIESLYKSTSWRISKPLRWIATRLSVRS